MSQAEFIRQALTNSRIRPVITVSPVNDTLLATVGKLTAEYGKIGSNLEVDCWSERDEKGRVEHIGMLKLGEVFEMLKEHLTNRNMLPDEYFLMGWRWDELCQLCASHGGISPGKGTVWRKTL